MNGEMLLRICTSYVQAFNSGCVPCIDNAWSYMCVNHCNDVSKKLNKQYEDEMSKLVLSEKISIIEFIKQHKILKKKLMSTMKEQIMGDNNTEYIKNLKDEIKSLKKEMIKKINNNLLEQNKQKLEGKMDEIRIQVRENKFNNINELRSILSKMKEEYLKDDTEFEGKETIFNELSDQTILYAVDIITTFNDNVMKQKAM